MPPKGSGGKEFYGRHRTFRRLGDKGVFGDPYGRWRTTSLFVETSKHLEDLPPLYCLNPLSKNIEGYEDLPCLKDLFFETDDPTGLTMADKYLGGPDHFQRLMESEWFRDIFEVWVEEYVIRKKAEGFKAIVEISRNPDHRSQLQAAKYILKEDWYGEIVSPRMGRYKRRGRKAKEDKLALEDKSKQAIVAEVIDIKEVKELLGGQEE